MRQGLKLVPSKGESSAHKTHMVGIGNREPETGPMGRTGGCLEKRPRSGSVSFYAHPVPALGRQTQPVVVPASRCRAPINGNEWQIGLFACTPIWPRGGNEEDTQRQRLAALRHWK